MSERFDTINVGGEDKECTRDNTTLYTHLGKYAIYDHVYVLTGDNTAAYIWRGHSQYDDLEDACVTNDCFMVLNRKEPADTDVKLYIEHALHDVDQADEMLERWTDERASDS